MAALRQRMIEDMNFRNCATRTFQAHVERVRRHEPRNGATSRIDV